MRLSLAPLLLVAALCGVCQPALLPAQASPPDGAACEGLTVTSIDVRAARPPFEGTSSRWRHVARAVGLHHATTRPGVIDAFLILEVGEPCTEKRRAESERLVRDQPFIADAHVRTVPDGKGGVAVIVETVDEIPVLLGGQVHGVSLQSLSLGNGNVGGEGLLAQLYLERGFAYRNGTGVRLIDYATFGRPYAATIEAFQHPLGFYRNVELAHPFYTDLQQYAWHVGVNDAEEYRGLSRVARDQLNLRVQQVRWDASVITRAFGTRTVTLLGVGAAGIRLTPATEGIIVSDTGLAPDTGTALRNRYQPFRAVRLGILGGVRRLSFRTVRGFDGLTAQQDVASGVMAGLYVAHGLPSAGESDIFLSGGVYAGKAGRHALLATVAQMEARRDPVSNTWDNEIGSGRAALYLSTAPGMLLLLDDRYSLGVNSRLPLQLDLGDRVGGILGYRNASLAGACRVAARAELRFSRESMLRNADLGFATFGELGNVWAGDAPYGTTASRATVGLSILAAYPTGSKRLYRADIGFPLTRAGTGGGRIEVRFSSENRASSFWTEPNDVARTRTGPVASTLFVTPNAR
jgi:hypothetical protein